MVLDRWRLMAWMALAVWVLPAPAAVISVSGALDDPGNAALVASDLGVAQFVDAAATANNVALHGFTLAQGGLTRFTSTAFAAGGIDPYFTLFAGSDRATATVLASNYAQASTLGGDFTLDVLLTPGDYTLAIGVFLNLSFAENLGSGVLADGFTGLGGPIYFGNGRYALDITLPDGGTTPGPGPGTVAEPGAAALSLTALLAAALSTRRRRAAPATATAMAHHQG